MRLRLATVVTAALAGTVLVAGPAAATGRPRAASADVYRFVATASTLQVQWRGNGHGIGMSQYGVLGAANAGLGPVQMLHFYYPHARLVTQPVQAIRVAISQAPGYTTVFGGAPNLRLDGVGRLPAGYAMFRLVPDGSGLAVQGKRNGSWTTLGSGLPSHADFFSSQHFLRILRNDGTSARYFGRMGAVRSGGGEITVNTVALDHYVAGVVAREVSVSWPLAARAAQAIAARSYALASKGAHGGESYDICDSTACQVYGGMSQLDASGNVIWRADQAAVAATRYQALTYQGSPIWAMYSASNGGATVNGGEPYFTAQNDPYDTVALAHDPYLSQSRTVSATAFASAFGLRSVTSITVKRDGIGPWGGRVRSAAVTGSTPSGATKTVSTSGSTLGQVTGIGTSYLRFSA
jgi:SpoIID/LytB domain protein